MMAEEETGAQFVNVVLAGKEETYGCSADKENEKGK
jgi:hypothetical protein